MIGRALAMTVVVGFALINFVSVLLLCIGLIPDFQSNDKASLSFIDIFVQKGFKITGSAVEVKPSEPECSGRAESLNVMAGDHFPISSVFVIKAAAVEPIVAPSYRRTPP